MLFNNFLGGIAWGVGVGVGTTLFATFMFFLLTKIDYVPLVGDFVANVMKYMSANTDNF